MRIRSDDVSRHGGYAGANPGNQPCHRVDFTSARLHMGTRTVFRFARGTGLADGQHAQPGRVPGTCGGDCMGVCARPAGARIAGHRETFSRRRLRHARPASHHSRQPARRAGMACRSRFRLPTHDQPRHPCHHAGAHCAARARRAGCVQRPSSPRLAVTAAAHRFAQARDGLRGPCHLRCGEHDRILRIHELLRRLHALSGGGRRRAVIRKSGRALLHRDGALPAREKTHRRDAA